MITFQTINVELPPIDQEAVRLWIETVARSYGRGVGDINYIFVDDAEILRVNLQFLQHDYYTDIITFDYSDTPAKPPISGDIFISLDTVRSNAEGLNVDYWQELHRVIIHGVLHLCGQNDKGPGEREQMEAAENRALEIRKNISDREKCKPSSVFQAGIVSAVLFLLFSCTRSTNTAQMDIDTLFCDTTKTAAAVLTYEDIYESADTLVVDSLLMDSIRRDSIALVHRFDSVPADTSLQLEEPE